MCKQMSSCSFKNVTSKFFTLKSYQYNMYKEDLVFNNLQGLIYHKILPTNT